MTLEMVNESGDIRSIHVKERQPLNPYARIFFGLWGLIVCLIVFVRLSSPEGGQPVIEQRYVELLESNPTLFHLAGLSWLKQDAQISGAERTLLSGKSSVQTLPLSTQQKRVSVRFCATGNP